MVRINRSSRPADKFGLQLHWAILGIVGFIFLIAGLYVVLNAQEAEMLTEMGRSRHLAEFGNPFIVYGTAWKKENTATFVNQAIHAGFRHIDTACQPKHYNEAGVGEGWSSAAEELGLKRSDIYIQTKFTSYSGQDPKKVPYDPHASLEDQIRQSLEVSLTNLKTDYLDTLVMHSPMNTVEETMVAWRVMESFVDAGKVKRLGMSNCYSYSKFLSIYDEARIKPSVLQNRLYADSNFDTDLREFCKEKTIWYQSFWTLTANRVALASHEVNELAEGKGLTPQTYMYAFLMSLGYITPLSGTTNTDHMAQDVAVMKRLQDGDVIFETEEEIAHMAKLLGFPKL